MIRTVEEAREIIEYLNSEEAYQDYVEAYNNFRDFGGEEYDENHLSKDKFREHQGDCMNYYLPQEGWDNSDMVTSYDVVLMICPTELLDIEDFRDRVEQDTDILYQQFDELAD